MADVEKSLSTKMEESNIAAPQAYKTDDSDSEIDDLFGMMDDDDEDDSFEEGEFELGNLIMGNDLEIESSPVSKSLSKSKPKKISTPQ